ncbi:MAG: hypothetical protein LAQ69_45490 [Acidobacteriia bacterium]|nr:hypothetical protein [Terriglobia bacterium]
MPDLPLANNDVSEKQAQLITKLKEKGGHAGNVALQRELGWEEEAYWPIRDRLVDSGLLELGRGRGGSVSLVTQVPLIQPNTSESVSTPVPLISPQRVSEGELYDPVADVLRKQWARDLRFRSHVVEVTARQGRRDTGGTWTRPDIVTAALRVFPHVPGKFFDLITFELKPFDGIDVTAVFEALSHRRAATQAYVWLHVPAGEESNSELVALLKRIEEEASQHGVGMIVGADPSDYSSWDLRLRAVRVEPDPESLNEFIAQQLSGLARDELAQWFR